MNSNEELLQRCFDNDLNDAEMKQVFSALARSAALREYFRSLQDLQHSMRSEIQLHPSVTLDKRIDQLTSGPDTTADTPIFPLRALFKKTVPLRTVAIAAMLLLFITGGLYLASPSAPKEIETQYVYIVQLPPVVVTSIQ